MKLSDIERKLSVIYRNNLVKPYFHGREKLSRPAIYNVISGGNYRMDNLLSLINSYGLQLTMNDFPVNDLESLGRALSSARNLAHIPQRNLLMRIKEQHPSFSSSRIYAIESGKNFQKNSFLDYLSGLEKKEGEFYQWDLKQGSCPLTEEEIDWL